jgi:nucleoside-diphosphate-sugar epimerase
MEYKMNIMKNTTYLITGGCGFSGFIGSYVVRDLLEEGAKVIVYDFNIDQGVVNQVVKEEKLKVTLQLR